MVKWESIDSQCCVMVIAACPGGGIDVDTENDIFIHITGSNVGIFFSIGNNIILYTKGTFPKLHSSSSKI